MSPLKGFGISLRSEVRGEPLLSSLTAEAVLPKVMYSPLHSAQGGLHLRCKIMDFFSFIQTILLKYPIFFRIWRGLLQFTAATQTFSRRHALNSYNQISKNYGQ